MVNYEIYGLLEYQPMNLLYSTPSLALTKQKVKEFKAKFNYEGYVVYANGQPFDFTPNPKFQGVN